MQILFWNIAGLNDPIKQLELRKIVNSTNYDIIGIVESKVRLCNINHIASFCFPSWQYIHNGTKTSVSKVLFCWKHNVNCTMIAKREQTISCSVVHMNTQFMLTMV